MKLLKALLATIVVVLRSIITVIALGSLAGE